MAIRGSCKFLLASLAAAGCISTNDVEFDFTPSSPSGGPVPMRAGLIRSGTVSGEGRTIEDRTQEHLAALAGSGAFAEVVPYSEWASVDVVAEVQERRSERRMSDWVAVFTVLPPFWALWLPYRSTQERSYALHVYDSVGGVATYRFTGEAQGWSWFLFTPDFDSPTTDLRFLAEIAAKVRRRRFGYTALSQSLAAMPHDLYDELRFVQLARRRDLDFQLHRILAADPTQALPDYFGHAIDAPWLHASGDAEKALLAARTERIGPNPRGKRVDCPTCGRSQDARFLYCDHDGMPLWSSQPGGSR